MQQTDMFVQIHTVIAHHSDIRPDNAEARKEVYLSELDKQEDEMWEEFYRQFHPVLFKRQVEEYLNLPVEVCDEREASLGQELAYWKLIGDQADKHYREREVSKALGQFGLKQYILEPSHAQYQEMQ